MKVFKYLILLLIVSSCGTHTKYDYEQNTDFSDYKTYAYFTDMETGFSQLDDKRLFAAIDTKLGAMGFTKVEDDPSFRIDIQSGEVLNNDNSNVGLGMGGIGTGVGGGVSIGFPLNTSTTQREISIEFVDDSKNGVFWQAVTTVSQHANNTPEKREAAILKMVERVFNNYPPKQ